MKKLSESRLMFTPQASAKTGPQVGTCLHADLMPAVGCYIAGSCTCALCVSDHGAVIVDYGLKGVEACILSVQPLHPAQF